MIPPSTISSPATIKSGMEIRGKESIACIIRCGITTKSIEPIKSPAKEAKPNVKAKGMPKQANTAKTRTITILMGFCPPRF